MIFKMYGRYKFNLDKDLYEDNEGNVIIIDNKGKKFFAKFVDNSGEEENELISDSFENLDVMIENYLYSLKKPKEIIETFPVPPKISEECIKMVQFINEVEE